MGERANIKTAAERLNMTEYALRLMIQQGRIPFFRIGGERGKIILDLALVEDTLRREALSNVEEFSGSGTLIEYGSLRKARV